MRFCRFKQRFAAQHDFVITAPLAGHCVLINFNGHIYAEEKTDESKAVLHKCTWDARWCFIPRGREKQHSYTHRH